MMMPLRDVWLGLAADVGPTPGGFRLQLIFSGDDLRAFAAVASNGGLPALLLEVPDGVRPRGFRALVTRAFQMSAPSVEGLPAGRWALVIELRDRAFSDLFEMLVGDVLGAVRSASGAHAALEGALRCVERWRRFVERKGEPLTDEEVRGLIGELVVLCRCARRFGADAALAAWSGPDRALRDFELPDSSVEVKTFQGDDAATVLISSPGQLDAVAQRPVYLAAVRLTPSDAQGFTLSEFAARALDIIGAGPAAAGALEERLATAGYLGAHAPLYVRRFVAGPVMTYAVTPRFPRIRTVDVPQGVLAVRFALSIPALAPFRVDSDAVIGGRVSEAEAV